MWRLIVWTWAFCLLAPVAWTEEGNGGPADVVAAFHQALTAGNREQALSLLAPEGVVFESGGAELSRAEYESHHLGADMEFSQSTTREVEDSKVHQVGDVAWVLTRSRTTGTFRGREIRSRGVETMILQRGDDGWRIVHIHWSSRPG